MPARRTRDTAAARLRQRIEQLNSPAASVRYGASKALRTLSETDPRLVYPHFDFFVSMLDSPNTFLRWDASRILANLSVADQDNKLDGLLEKYLSPITGHQLIPAANTIRWAARIAAVKPHLAGRIAAEILRVEEASYKTPECRNVALGHAIAALGEFFPLIGGKAAVLAFVERQLGNSRAATRAKAERFLKKWRPRPARGCG